MPRPSANKSKGLSSYTNRTKMGFNTIDSIVVNWEVTQKLGPMVPMDLRELTMQAFHGVGHPEAEGDHNKNKQIRRLRPLVRPAVTCSFMDWYPGMASWGQRPQIMAILLQGCGDLKGTEGSPFTYRIKSTCQNTNCWFPIYFCLQHFMNAISFQY